MSTPDQPSAPLVANRLVEWLPSVRRDLPWRRRRDPYAVWVSEIMLQQTQVITVIPYFERWLAQFPDIATLAAAPLDTVLKAWEGLGYYARARNMHRAAQLIVTRHSGELPASRVALMALHGIGRYTAGAILSLAFGQREPVVDGNVRRVLCRVYDIAEDVRRTGTEETLWDLARRLALAAPEGKVGDVNEALMELGALICTPGLPACPSCPLFDPCLARQRNVQAERPVTAPRTPTPHYPAAAAVIQDQGGRYLIAQRPVAGLLGGLWEFPGTQPRTAESSPPTAAAIPDHLARTLQKLLGIVVQVDEPILQVNHAYTHFRVTLHAFRCRWLSGEPSALAYYTAVKWVTPAEFAAYPFPVTHLKVLKALKLPKESA
jgi:A/G-specific adenine glycosylase